MVVNARPAIAKRAQVFVGLYISFIGIVPVKHTFPSVSAITETPKMAYPGF